MHVTDAHTYIADYFASFSRHAYARAHMPKKIGTEVDKNTLTETPGMSFLGRTSTLKMRRGTASVATAFGTSTMPVRHLAGEAGMEQLVRQHEPRAIQRKQNPQETLAYQNKIKHTRVHVKAIANESPDGPEMRPSDGAQERRR
jgi:hypothetical protein